MPSPTLKQLRSLVALGRAGTFGRAAAALGVTQPSLSAQIQGLEEVLGLDLVERHRRGATLTPMGREVVRRAEPILAQVQDITALAHGAAHGLVGTLRLGTSPTIGPYLLPFVVPALRAQHPDLKLYIQEQPPISLDEGLASADHDLILTQLPSASAGHVAAVLFREPLMLALAKDHPLCAKPAIEVADLAGLNVLTLSRGYRLHDQVKDICDRFDADLAYEYEGTSLDALRQMVGMDMGAAFLPALYVRSEIREDSEVVVRRITGRALFRQVGLVWRKQAGRAAQYGQLSAVIADVAKDRFADLETG